MKIARLIFVSEDNHNKFYNMTEDGSSFKAEWGRVGNEPQTQLYPISKWDSTLKSKKVIKT